jgi:3-phosphoshikimate 1-carboxyvinyltransferase
MNAVITPVGQLLGEADIPGDKSISHRGIMFGSLARGTTRLTNFLKGDDCLNTINAFRSMGIDIDIEEKDGNTGEIVLVHGKGLRGLKKPADIIDVGNSGTTARLITGILAGQSFTSMVDGDESLRKRPMARIIEPLTMMGASIQAADRGTLPLSIQGSKLKGMEYKMPVASAQVKSAIILATLYADSPTVIYQPAQSRDHTEIMLRHFGGNINEDGTILTVYPVEELFGQEMRIPGDISSAAYLITAALLVPKSHVVMKGVGINPTRTGIIDVYKQMGARITIENADFSKGEPTGDIIVENSNLHGVNIGGSIIPRLIDEIPIIALAATQAQGTTIIKDAAELKVKESNRIDMVVNTLKALGADIEATEDGMAIHGPSRLVGNKVACNMDHRIAMMAAIAGLIASGETVISDGQWVNVSFPGFFDLIQKLRA